MLLHCKTERVGVDWRRRWVFDHLNIVVFTNNLVDLAFSFFLSFFLFDGPKVKVPDMKSDSPLSNSSKIAKKFSDSPEPEAK